MQNFNLKKNVMEVIEYRDNLLQAVNDTALLLLNSDIAIFSEVLCQGMRIIANAVNADCVYIWKNRIIDGELCCFQLLEWSEKETVFNTEDTVYRYNETFIGWHQTLAKGDCVNSPARELAPPVQAFLARGGIKSVLIVPIFIKDEFWGIVGFDDCRNERVFTKEEETVLKSASLLIANSFIRNEMTHDIIDKSERLEAAVKEANEATRIRNNSLKALENTLNSIDAAIYATIPATGELLFVNTWLKRTFKIEGDSAIGKFCYKVFREGRESRCDFCPCHELKKKPNSTIVWEEYMPNFDSYVLHSDCLIDWPDGSKVHLQHAIDITEMIRAREKARATNRAKSDFSAHKYNRF